MRIRDGHLWHIFDHTFIIRYLIYIELKLKKREIANLKTDLFYGNCYFQNLVNYAV